MAKPLKLALLQRMLGRSTLGMGATVLPMPTIVKQAIIAERSLGAPALVKAILAVAPRFSGEASRHALKRLSATLLRVEEFDGPGPVLSDQALDALAAKLGGKARSWSITLAAGTADGVRVVAFVGGKRERKTEAQSSSAPLAAIQQAVLGTRSPAWLGAGFDDALAALPPWEEGEVLAFPPATSSAADLKYDQPPLRQVGGEDGSRLVQLTGSLKYPARIPAIVAFVKKNGLKATDERSGAERQTLKAAEALLTEVGGAFQEPLVLRDKQSGTATGGALAFDGSMRLWLYLPPLPQPRRAKRR